MIEVVALGLRRWRADLRGSLGAAAIVWAPALLVTALLVLGVLFGPDRPGAAMGWVLLSALYGLVADPLVVAPTLHAWHGTRGTGARLAAGAGQLLVVVPTAAAVAALTVGAGLLLVLPALAPATVLLFVVPVTAWERRDPVRAVARSWRLGRGHRLGLLALVAASWTARWTVKAVLVLAGEALAGRVGAAAAVVLAQALDVIATAVSGALVAAAYLRARAQLEGEAADLVRVFE